MVDVVPSTPFDPSLPFHAQLRRRACGALHEPFEFPRQRLTVSVQAGPWVRSAFYVPAMGGLVRYPFWNGLSGDLVATLPLESVVEVEVAVYRRLSDDADMRVFCDFVDPRTLPIHPPLQTEPGEDMVLHHLPAREAQRLLVALARLEGGGEEA